jgi:hypothetical protein
MIALKNRIGEEVRRQMPNAPWPNLKGLTNKQIRKLARSMGITEKNR